MSRYYTTSLYVFSIIGGIVTFFLLSSFADTTVSALFGVITTLSLSITIPVMYAFADRKFISLRKEIKEPIIIDERVNYVVGQEVRQGFMLTTKDSLFILSSENKKPVKFEIKKSDIIKISISEDVFLNIFLDYDKCIRIFSGDCEKLSSMLSKEGFGRK